MVAFSRKQYLRSFWDDLVIKRMRTELYDTEKINEVPVNGFLVAFKPRLSCDDEECQQQDFQGLFDRFTELSIDATPITVIDLVKYQARDLWTIYHFSEQSVVLLMMLIEDEPKTSLVFDCVIADARTLWNIEQEWKPEFNQILAYVKPRKWWKFNRWRTNRELFEFTKKIKGEMTFEEFLEYVRVLGIIKHRPTTNFMFNAKIKLDQSKISFIERCLR